MHLNSRLLDWRLYASENFNDYLEILAESLFIQVINQTKIKYQVGLSISRWDVSLNLQS